MRATFVLIGKLLHEIRWRIEYTCIMYNRVPWMGMQFCWESSGSAVDDSECIKDGMTPEEAVDSEMSYWEE